MNRKKLIYILLLFLTLQMCNIKLPNDSDMPNWDVDLNFPMGEKTFFAKDLLKDSTTTVYLSENGDSVIAFENSALEMKQTKIGDSLKIGNITESYSQSIDDVEVEDVQKKITMDMSEVSLGPFDDSWSDDIGPANLRDNSPKGSTPARLYELFDFTEYEEGETVTIPQNTTFPPVYRTVNFDEFDEARIKSGYIDVRIVNNLVTELGSPVIVTLLNPDSSLIQNDRGEILTTTFNMIIPSKANSGLRAIPLDHHPLPNEILVKVDGNICGNGGQDIENTTENKNSHFILEVSTRQIIVSSAVAIVPEQNFDTTSTVALPESDHELISATIKEGTLKIQLINRLDLDLLVDIEIPNLEKTGMTFLKTINVAAMNTKIVELSLNDYTITPENDSIRVISTMTTVTTDPNKIYIEESHGIDVACNFFGNKPGDNIVFKEFEGIVSQEKIEKTGEIDIESETRITSATISQGRIDIRMNNEVVKEIDENILMTLLLPEIRDEFNHPIEIGPLEIAPGQNTISINENENSLSGYTFHPLENAEKKQVITYLAEIMVPDDNYGTYDLENSFLTDVNITGLKFSSVTGYFNEESIVREDSTAFPDDNKLDEADFKEGRLVVRSQNNLGLNADVHITLYELINKETQHPLKITLAMNSNEMDYEHIEDLQNYRFVNKDNRDYLYYKSSIAIPGEEEMTLESDKTLNGEISLENIKLNHFAGFIDTIDVKVENIEETIAEFPEELKDVNLEKTEIEIQFDTNIGADLQIDFVITSSNSAGDEESVAVNHIIRADDASTKIIRLQESNKLLNIAPEKIIINGILRIFGEGHIAADQYLGGRVNILVPMIISIDENTDIRLDIEQIKPNLPEEIQAVIIHSRLRNSFDLTGKLQVLISQDSLDLLENSPLKPDTLLAFYFHENESFNQQIELSYDKIELLSDSCFIRNVISLDATSDNEKIGVLTSDSLNIMMYGTIKTNIDLKNDEE